MKENAFEAMTVETLPDRLGSIPEIADRLGGAPAAWKVREVGDGNLNLVFIVEGEAQTLIIKQALPYVRLVGDSWPLPLKRSFFEYHALTRQEKRAPGTVPAVYYFDEAQALIAMEFLSPHIILRRALIEGQELPKIGRDLGLFMARTLFRGSDLSMKAADRKADLALFADNVDLCDITENLVFSDPYFEAPMNRHTPGLDALVKELRSDRDLKVAAQRMKHLFASESRDHGAWRPAFGLRHGHEGRHPRHRSGIRLLRPHGLRCRHAACQLLDGLFLPARARGKGRPRLHARLSAWRHFRDMDHLPRRVRPSVAHRAQRNSLSNRPI